MLTVLGKIQRSTCYSIRECYNHVCPKRVVCCRVSNVLIMFVQVVLSMDVCQFQTPFTWINVRKTFIILVTSHQFAIKVGVVAYPLLPITFRDSLTFSFKLFSTKSESHTSDLFAGLEQVP